MVLLDTHILLWWINGTPGKLPRHLIERIENAESVAVSAISCFEIEWLVRHGRIEMEISLDEWFSGAFSETGLICMPVTGIPQDCSVIHPHCHGNRKHQHLE